MYMYYNFGNFVRFLIFTDMLLTYFLDFLFDKQIYREFLRLSEGVGLKAHYISKSTTEKRLEKKYGKYL